MLGLLASVLTAATPDPEPTLEVDPTLVTPGVIGFAVTALLIGATIALVIDMSRRIRRVRYREEARERIAAELDARVVGGEQGEPGANRPVDDDPTPGS